MWRPYYKVLENIIFNFNFNFVRKFDADFVRVIFIRYFHQKAKLNFGCQ